MSDSSPRSELLEQRLSALRSAYSKRLPERVRSIGQLADEYITEPSNELVVQLRQAAHKLKGSGATYGFMDVSSAAAALESITVAHLQEGKTLDPEQLRAHVARLEQVVNQ